MIAPGSTMAAPTRREPGVTTVPEIEHSFAVVAQGYEPCAVDARVAELATARAELVRRAEQLQREAEELTRLLAARTATAVFEGVLADLQSTLGAAYTERVELRLDAESRGRQERAQAQALIRMQLAQVDEEAQRATAAAEVAAGQLVEEAARAAAEIRASGAETAASIAAGAVEVLETARVKVAQRSEEIVADLTSWQRTCEETLSAAQARADTRLEQAVRAAAVDTDQARATIESAEQTAARITGEARATAADLIADSRLAAERLQQESERAAAEVAANLRSIGRFVDGLPLPVGLTDPASQTDPAAGGRGSLAEVTPLRSWRRTR